MVAESAAFTIDSASQVVETFNPEQYDRDPRPPRWGYNPGLRGVQIDPRRTGLATSHIPVGEFVVHKTFPTPRENYTLDEYKPKEDLVTVLAAESEAVTLEHMGASGYQIVLFGVADIPLVQVINRTLLPKLSEIRALFPDDSPISAKCPSEDELDYGDPREICATCHLAWIKSEHCQAYLEQVLGSGQKVQINTSRIGEDGRIYVDSQTRHVQPKLKQLEDTRDSIRKGLEAYIKYASTIWGKSVSELNDGTRKILGLDEHFLRKDLHKMAPQDKELGMMREFADQISNNQRNAEHIPAAPGGMDPAFLEYLREKDAKDREMQLAMADRFASLAAAPAPAKYPDEEENKPDNPADSPATDKRPKNKE